MKLEPFIGQLPTGEYAIFNMQDTSLWDKTFETRADAVRALFAHAIETRVKRMNEADALVLPYGNGVHGTDEP